MTSLLQILSSDNIVFIFSTENDYSISIPDSISQGEKKSTRMEKIRGHDKMTQFIGW